MEITTEYLDTLEDIGKPIVPDPSEPTKNSTEITTEYLDTLENVDAPVPSARVGTEVTMEYLDTLEDIEAPATIIQNGDADNINDLMSDKNFAVVNQYMGQRFGMDEKNYDRKEVVDSYINHMRKFSFGQSVTTLGELSYLNSTTNINKSGAGQAYTLFDNMNNAFSSEYTLGQKADAVGDYARALIVDPVNILSLGIGKLITGGATKAAATLAKQAVKQTLIKEFGKGVLKKSTPAKQQRASIIEREVLSKLLKGEAIKGARKGAFQKKLKEQTRTEIMAGTAFDASASVGVDAAYQQAMITTGVQSEYNVLQGVVTGATGVVGGSLAYGMSLLNKAPHTANTLPIATHFMLEAEKNAARAKAAAKIGLGKDIGKSIKDFNMKDIRKALRENNKATKRWAIKVLDGDTKLREGAGVVEPRSAVFMDAFLHGDLEGGTFKGVSQIFDDYGIQRDYRNDGTFANLTDFITESIKALPKGIRSEITELYETTMQRVPAYNKMGLNDAMDAMASEVSSAGRNLGSLSLWVRSVKKAKGKTKDEKMLSATEAEIEPLVGFPATKEKMFETTAAIQQNLIRLLVTHPGTVALNIAGWLGTSALQSYSDVVRGGLYGGRSLVAALVGNKVNAKEYANLAKSMLTLQGQALRNLVNPYATKEAAMDFLAYNPKAQKELFRYISGGIELKDVYKDIGIKLDGAPDEGTWTKVMDFAQNVYGVKAQDILSKTQAFMYQMDKQVRLNFGGKSYAEFIQDENLYKSLKGDLYLEMQASAVQDALRMVSAKSYKSKDALGQVAGIIENIRKVPVLGAMVPFGQFFNNTLGHMFDHTGLTIAHKFFAKTSRDPIDIYTKAAAGYSLIGLMAYREKDNMEEGLGVFQERTSDGSIRDRIYDFPISYYKAMGRMAAHLIKDGFVPEGVKKQFLDTFGTRNLTRTLGETTKETGDLLISLVTGGDADWKKESIGMLRDSFSMYASAYSRPLDPVNQIVGLMRGEDYKTIDRKQGPLWATKSGRYVDQIFSALSGKELAPEKYTATSDVRKPSPIGRIFGYREVSAQSSIQQMFNEVGKPDWRTEIKSFIPEVQNDINRLIFKYLESYAENTISKEGWKNASQDDKEASLSKILSMAKEDVLFSLENSYSNKDSKTAKLFKLSNGNTAEKAVIKAIKELNLDIDFTEMTEEEIDFLVYYIKLNKDDQKDRATSLTNLN